MPNAVESIRQAVLAAHPEAVVSNRGRNFIKHRIADAPNGRPRFVLDAVIGSYHYGPAQNQEINTDWTPASAPWNYEMLAADYNAKLVSRFDAGMIARYIDPYTGEYVEFQPQNLQYSNDLDQIQSIGIPQNVNAVITENAAYWTGAYGTGRDFTWIPTPDRLEKWLKLLTPASLPTPTATTRNGGNPVIELNIVFRRSAGVELWIDGVRWNEAPNNPRTTTNRIEFRQTSTGTVLWWIDLPQTVDVAGEQVIGNFRLKKQGPSLYVSIRVPLSWIEDAARVWPISIDTTVVDKQVAASGDDGRRFGTSFDINNQVSYVGYYTPNNYHFFTRWIGVSISGTINVSYMEVLYNTVIGSPYAKIYGVDEDNPAAPTTAAQFDADPLTTAAVDWDGAWVAGWNTSPSLNTILQELVDTYTVSNDAVMFQVKNDGTTENHYNACYAYDYPGNVSGPKLHIEYTAAGGADISVVGALTFVGTLARANARASSGSLTFAGMARKTPTRSFTASLSLAGALAASKFLNILAAGALTLAGVIGRHGGKLLAGSLSLAGAVSRDIAKLLSASLSLVGVIAKSSTASVSGALSFVGVAAKTPGRLLDASLSMAGTINRVITRLLAATLNMAGTLATQLISIGQVVLAATLTMVGSITKDTERRFVGVQSFASTIVRTPVKVLSGSLSFAAAISRTSGKNLAGALTIAGLLVRNVSGQLSASLNLSGAIARTSTRVFSGVLNFVGTISKAPVRPLSGALTLAGTMTRDSLKLLDGTLATAGTISRFVDRSLAAVLSTAGAIATQLISVGAIILTATLNMAGAITKQTGRSMGGALTLAGVLARDTMKSLSASLSFVGGIQQAPSIAMAGALTMAGLLTKALDKTLMGSLTFMGNIAKSISLALTAVLQAIGTIAVGAPAAIEVLLSASLAFTGIIVKHSAKILDAFLSFGTFPYTFPIYWDNIQGGSIQKDLNRALDATLTMAGAISRASSRGLVAALTMAGTIGRAVSRALTGVLTFLGSLLTTRRGQVTLSDSLVYNVAVANSVVYGSALTDSLVYSVAVEDSP